MKDLFYVVAMKTKRGQTLYLKEGHNNNFEWTFDFQESIWFETEDDTKKFANDYFKIFFNTFVSEIFYEIACQICPALFIILLIDAS